MVTAGSIRLLPRQQVLQLDEVPLDVHQCAKDQLTLRLFNASSHQGHREVPLLFRNAVVLQVLLDVLRLQVLPLLEHKHAFNHVAQLPDVTGPVV